MQTIRSNLKIGADTQYSNFNFTSMCKFNGVVLGAGPSGLFKCCCGEDDNGTEIEAYFIPIKTKLGLNKQKRIDQVYIGGVSDGSVQIEITGDAKESIGPYGTPYLSTEYQTRRVTPGKGYYWVYGSIKVSNIAGSSFAIDLIDLLVQAKT